MMHKLQKKLRSRAGESLVEVLVAMLIIALATMLLVSMITAASHIDTTARARDITFAQDLEKAEMKLPSGARSDVPNAQITVKLDNGSEESYDVTLYGGHGLTSYNKKGGSGS